MVFIWITWNLPFFFIAHRSEEKIKKKGRRRVRSNELGLVISFLGFLYTKEIIFRVPMAGA